MENKGKAQTFLGFAVRAGKYRTGFNSVASIKKAYLIVVCKTASENSVGEAKKIAKKFVYSIGKGYTDEEVELCKYTSDSIDKILVKLKSDMADRVKMYYSLPLLFVSSVILIFL